MKSLISNIRASSQTTKNHSKDIPIFLLGEAVAEINETIINIRNSSNKFGSGLLLSILFKNVNLSCKLLPKSSQTI